MISVAQLKLSKSRSHKREVLISHNKPVVRTATFLFVKGKFAEKSSLRTIDFAALKDGYEEIAVHFSVLKTVALCRLNFGCEMDNS